MTYKIHVSLFMLFLTTSLPAQMTETFESFNLPVDTFLNGSDGVGGFLSGNVFLVNNYNTLFDSWEGWSISTMTDTTTPGFMNEYSAVAGNGNNSSLTYCVSYQGFSPGGTVFHIQGAAKASIVNGISVTNSTYAYRSMFEGDAFAKRFGGETGSDPDFFLLTIKAWYGGALSEDSVDFYLADYRFEDHSQDYIIKQWTFVDLTSLGQADSLLFKLSSSDAGQFGMNTPAYFCMDDVLHELSTSAQRPVQLQGNIYPNPATDYLIVDWYLSSDAICHIIDNIGITQKVVHVSDGQNQIPTAGLPSGRYSLLFYDRHFLGKAVFVKL